MTALEKNLAVFLRRVFKHGFRFKDKFETTSDNVDYFGQEASDIIYNGIMSDQPFALSRFGYSELRALLTYSHIEEKSPTYKKMLDFATGKKVEPWWHENTVKIITYNAGVFPVQQAVIERFSAEIFKDIDKIDVIGSWLGGEEHIKHLMPSTKFIRFHDFYHFLHQNPWTNALKNKKVLVIHPFTDSIKEQYAIKDKIYSPPHTLPHFDLQTLTAVQTIAGNNQFGFKDWFEALDYMKEEINKIDFEVAILGCGAYGMPLAIHIKKLGKKAIHLGGNVQFLFGIKGERWEKDPIFTSQFNEYWIRPKKNETPSGHKKIDSNCYW